MLKISHIMKQFKRTFLALAATVLLGASTASAGIGLSQAQVSRLEKNAIRSIKQEL